MSCRFHYLKSTCAQPYDILGECMEEFNGKIVLAEDLMAVDV